MRKPFAASWRISKRSPHGMRKLRLGIQIVLKIWFHTFILGGTKIKHTLLETMCSNNKFGDKWVYLKTSLPPWGVCKWYFERKWYYWQQVQEGQVKSQSREVNSRSGDVLVSLAALHKQHGRNFDQSWVMLRLDDWSSPEKQQWKETVVWMQLFEIHFNFLSWELENIIEEWILKVTWKEIVIWMLFMVHASHAP